MTPEKEQLLIERYPKIFESCTNKDKQSLMHYGMSCSDGWFDLIDTLCAGIQQRVVQTARMVETPQCRAVQIKEKFGGLRFYVLFEYENEADREDEPKVRAMIESIYGMIQMAENMSYRLCEECGSSGTLRKGGWYRTLCQKCEDQRATRYAPSATDL